MADQSDREHASAGHKLGQLIGDWFEEFIVSPMLQDVAQRLRLYLDHRFRRRPARGDAIVWSDEHSNRVSYDFVMELNGTDEQLGIPVAFLESFWRRGARHSKDKARDDSGKLIPMRSTHPSARFLGIIAAGDFTEPARALVRSREIDLFYVPKDKIVAAFAAEKLKVDYPDKAPEDDKRLLADHLGRRLNKRVKERVARRLVELVGPAAISSYVNRVHAALAALPQEIRFVARHRSVPRVFESIADATRFLEKPEFLFDDPIETYAYEITYSDGTEFSRELQTLDELRALHEEVQRLADHINGLNA